MAETTLNKLASSLPVPLVQELAKQPLDKVPERYVRPDQYALIISNTTNSLPQVPVIDMKNLFSQELGESELEKMHIACKEWGFFQLINHGVSPSLVESVKKGIEQLFNLPIEEKEKFRQKPGDMEGLGQAFVVSEEQKLDWADIFLITMRPKHIRKSHLFPNFPNPFRENLDAYSLEVENIVKKLLYQMAKVLRMEPNDMKELFDEGGWQNMRMNYYPPCPQPDLVIGLNSHSDADALTILLQINEMEGLQIRKDGMWIPVKPLPNAFIVNVGDILEILTNGIYRSIEHRAKVNGEKYRLSLATFLSPKLDREIGPAPSLVTPEKPALFRRIRVADYYKGYLSRELDRKSYLDVIRINNEEEKSSKVI
ncbi:hypothetical protein UlMin_018792 [Ulmus minor]